MQRFHPPATRPFARCRTAVAVCVLIGLAASGICRAGEAEQTAQYFRELRARRLFNLAERYCLERLGGARVSPLQRSALTIELSRCFADHATFAPPAEQQELWKRAADTIDEFLAKNADHPARALLEAQRATLPAARGRWLRWKADADPDDTAVAGEARQTLTRGIELLKESENKLAEEARKAPLATSRDQLAPHEFRAELYAVRYQTALALVELAELTRAGDPARKDYLKEAESRLGALVGGFPGEELSLDSQVVLARTLRLAGNPKRAWQQLAAVEETHPPLVVMDRVMIEKARLLIEQDAPKEVVQVIGAYERQYRSLPGELSYLRIQLLVEMLQAARDRHAEDLSSELQVVIDAQLQRLVQDVGGYWAERAKMLLAQSEDVRILGAETARLVRQARRLYLAGKSAESVQAYAEAAAAAQKSGRDAPAFDLRYTAGSIQLEAKDYEGAAKTFQELVEQSPQNARAADAHLLEAYALGRIYEAQATKANREAYTAALERHRERFSGSPTVNEALWMQAQLEERRLQASVALRLYRSIPNDHPRHAAAQLAIARCYEKIIDRVHEQEQSPVAWETAAIQELEPMLSGANRLPEEMQTEISLRLARIMLRRNPPEFAKADRLLENILNRAPPGRVKSTEDDAPAVDPRKRELYRQAAQWRVISLAGQGRVQEAETTLKRFADAGAAELLAILDGLTQIRVQSEKTQQQLVRLQLTAAEQLAAFRTKLDAAEQRRLDICLAQGYAATGRTDRAIELYEQLARSGPRDIPTLNALGQLLSRCGTADCLARAEKVWRRLESHEKAGTVAWLEARLRVAETLLARGEKEQCGKLLGVTKILYPKLGDEAQRERLAKLEAACREKGK
jgi:TolA-binding protein